MPATYRERQSVPVLYWVIAAAFGLTFIVAVGGYFPWGWFLAATVVGTALLVGALILWSRPLLVVGPDGVRIGRYLLEWEYVGDVRSLSADEQRRRLGPEADARALLAVRPYLKQAIEVEVDDHADPVPYWLIGTRHPDRAVSAVAAWREQHSGARPAPARPVSPQE
jgi:hypothetical protein